MQQKLHSIISGALASNRLGVVDWAVAPIPTLAKVAGTPSRHPKRTFATSQMQSPPPTHAPRGGLGAAWQQQSQKKHRGFASPAGYVGRPARV